MKKMQFALATEAEWHYAAHGGRKSQGYIYAGSNTLGDVAWYADNAEQASHFVASKQPNELGIYDSESYTCTYSYHGREKEHSGCDATLGFRIVLRRVN